MSQDLTRKIGEDFLSNATSTSWEPPHDMDENSWERWLQYLQLASDLQDALPWWIGDMLRYGEAMWGEVYAQATEVTGYSEASLLACRWVAGRIPPHRRWSTLSWSHHREVAARKKHTQDELLKRASDEQLSVNRLRLLVRESKHDTEQTPEPIDPKSSAVRCMKYLRMARGQSCVRCGIRDGTVVAAHYQGQGAQRLGKGVGEKPHDFAVADLCQSCHQYFDEGGRDDEKDAEFLLLILVTQERRYRQGALILETRRRAHE